MIAIRGTQHPWPRETNTQIAVCAVPFNDLAVFVDQHRLYAWQRQGGITRFGFGYACYWRDHKPAGFSLPPRIDDGTFALAYFFIKPVPGLLINGFAYRAQFFKRTKILSFQCLIAKTHQGTDSGRRRVQDIDLKFLHDIPKTPGRWPRGYPLKHNNRSALR